MTRFAARPLPALLASALSLCALVYAPQVFAAPLVPTAIFASTGSSSPSTVPGTTQNFLSLNRATFSADGTQWALPARTNTGDNNTDGVIIRGNGFTAVGSTVALREGTAAPEIGAGVFYGLINDQIAVNNSGQFAASVILDDYNGSTTPPVLAENNGALVRGTGSTLEIIARERQQAIGAPAGTVYGPTVDGQNLLSNGNVLFRNFITTTNQYLLEASAPGVGTVVSQSGNFPTGQLVSPAQGINAFGGTTRFVSDGAGANTLYSATLAGATATNSVVIFNGTVVAQIGAALPGATTPSANVFSLDGLLSMSGSNGNYRLRGSVNDGTTAATRTDFVLGNGALVAKTGDAIFAGSVENWDDTASGTTATFFASSVNSQGQSLIGGYTTGAASNNEAVVVDGNVVLREGDRVDVNGDGVLDDNAFISRFVTDNLTLTDTGLVYALVNLQDATGAETGTAFIARSVAVIPESGTLPLITIGLSLLGATLPIIRRKN